MENKQPFWKKDKPQANNLSVVVGDGMSIKTSLHSDGPFRDWLLSDEKGFPMSSDNVEYFAPQS